MPNRRYHSHNPPTRTDHALAHPYGIAIAVFTLLVCVTLLAQSLAATALIVSPTVNALPAWMALIISASGIASGVCMISGILHEGDDLMIGWRQERTGLILGILTWFLYGASVAIEFPSSVVSYMLALTFAVGHGLRFAATIVEERRSRSAIARMTEGA